MSGRQRTTHHDAVSSICLPLSVVPESTIDTVLTSFIGSFLVIDDVGVESESLNAHRRSRPVAHQHTENCPRVVRGLDRP